MAFLKKLNYLDFKFELFKPSVCEILVMDDMNFHELKPIVKKYDYKLLKTRKITLNIYVIFLLIINIKPINAKNYFSKYIELCNPKLVLTLNDSNILFYKLKKQFPLINFFAIQVGHRSRLFFHQLKSQKNLQCDYLFTWGKNYSNLFLNHIKCKCIELGSFLSNRIQKRKKKRSSVAYISSRYPAKKIKVLSAGIEVKSDIFWKAENYLLPIIYNFCKKKKINLEIIGKCNSSNNSGEAVSEKNFYKKILNNKKFFFHKNKGSGSTISPYKVCDEVELNIGVSTSMVAEVIARGSKCCIIDIRDKFSKVKNWSNPLYPYSKKNLKFFVNKIDENKIIKTLNKIYNLSSKAWEKEKEKIIPHQILFNKKNNILVSKIKQVLSSQ